MPAIQFRHGCRTFYPDTSTLIYAFEGADLRSDRGARELFAVINDAARNANLLLSYVHLLELVRGDQRDIRERAAIIDSLDVVWMLGNDLAELHEIENLLCSTAAGQRVPPPIPVAPSFLRQFHELRLDDVPALLKDSRSVIDYLQGAADDRDHLQRIQQFAALGRSMNQRLPSLPM